MGAIGRGILMRQRGQAALEFIMLVLIIIIYLTTITWPLVENAKGVAGDVETMVWADAEAKRVVNSITEVAMLGKGTQKTVNLFVPANAEIRCAEGKVGFMVRLRDQLHTRLGFDAAGNCTQERCCELGRCDKNFFFPANLRVDCEKTLMTGKTSALIYNNGAIGSETVISVK